MKKYYKNASILPSMFFISTILLAKSATAGLCPIINGILDMDILSELDGTEFGDFNCNYTPDMMQLKIHKIMLCKDLVNNSNYLEKCTSLVDDASGRSVTVKENESSPLLDGPVSLTEGKYDYSVIVMSNKVETQFVQEFSKNIMGNNGIGTTCWSNGNDSKISYEDTEGKDGDPTIFSASCGSSNDANPQLSGYTYKAFYNDANNGVDNYFVNKFLGLTLFGGNNKDIYILSNETNIAEISAGDGGRNMDDENGLISNGIYVMGVTKHDNPIEISAATNGIELGFKLKNTYFQKITTNNNYYGKSVSGNKICSDGQGVISESSETGAYACLSTSYPIDFDFRVRTY